jgi:hypothetical protein
VGVPAAADALAGTQVFDDTSPRCGTGGRGGDATWDTRQGSLEYPLDAISFAGGRGGNGVQEGGEGGNASYLSGRAVNARGTPVAAVTVQGGDGGEVGDLALVPVAGALAGFGGVGGPVVGNAGWDGGVAGTGAVYEDGAPGGDVTGRGGKGGGILADASFYPDGQGGNGGSVSGQSGPGGRGRSGCDPGSPPPPRAGGNGGSSGALELRGGDGGDGIARGGSGGAVRRYGRNQPGRGGDGDPAGVCGSLGILGPVPGHGGKGEAPGADGAVDAPGDLACDGSAHQACGAATTTTTIVSVPTTLPTCQVADESIHAHYRVEYAPGGAVCVRDITSSVACSSSRCDTWIDMIHDHVESRGPGGACDQVSDSDSTTMPDLFPNDGAIFFNLDPGNWCSPSGAPQRPDGTEYTDPVTYPTGQFLYTETFSYSCSGGCCDVRPQAPPEVVCCQIAVPPSCWERSCYRPALYYPEDGPPPACPPPS